MKIVVMEPLAVGKGYLEQCFSDVVKAGNELVIYDTKTTDAEEQKRRAAEADVLVIANTPLSGEVIEACDRLKYLAVAFTGVDHVDIEACRRKSVAVSNAAGYSTNGVTELVFGLAEALYRYLISCDSRVRNGGTKDGLVGNLLAGKTVGIVGAGLIGKRVAALAKAFGCRTIAYNRSEVKGAAIDRQVSLEELLKESDIVSLHCPLTDETKGLVGKEQLALMKETAILLNTARGGVLDSQALADALTKGEIAGAAIDVFENEPPLDTAHPLLNCPNAIVTPHIGFASAESLEQRADIVFENLYSWLRGKQINAVK